MSVARFHKVRQRQVRPDPVRRRAELLGKRVDGLAAERRRRPPAIKATVAMTTDLPAVAPCGSIVVTVGLGLAPPTVFHGARTIPVGTNSRGDQSTLGTRRRIRRSTTGHVGGRMRVDQPRLRHGQLRMARRQRQRLSLRDQVGVRSAIRLRRDIVRDDGSRLGRRLAGPRRSRCHAFRKDRGRRGPGDSSVRRTGQPHLRSSARTPTLARACAQRASAVAIRKAATAGSPLSVDPVVQLIEIGERTACPA